MSTEAKAPNSAAVAKEWETATHQNTEFVKGLGLTSATTPVSYTHLTLPTIYSV